jgi:hypothetical protein
MLSGMCVCVIIYLYTSGMAYLCIEVKTNQACLPQSERVNEREREGERERDDQRFKSAHVLQSVRHVHIHTNRSYVYTYIRKYTYIHTYIRQ